MASRAEKYAWVVAMAVLVTFAVPWFMWGEGRTAAGLPLWLWWHVGWMALSAAVFWLFAKRAWGVGVTGAGGGRA
jgi:hypothetical protein